MSEATKQTPIRVVLILIAIGFLIYRPTRIPVLAAMIAFPLANALTDSFKFMFPMDRPCVALPYVHLRVGFLDSNGTASAHSANTAAVAFAFTRYLPKWGVIPIAVALFTGLSRIYVGVHFPSQVLLGWICGIFVGWVVTATIEWIRRKRSNDEPIADPEPEMA